MNDQTQELIYWLTIEQIPDFGFATFKKLLAHFQSVENICKAKSHELQRLKLTNAQIEVLQKPNHNWIATALKWHDQPNHHIILLTDARYPPLLTEISSRPLILYAHGEWEILSQPQIAVVGSRNPSHTGSELSSEFAYQLSKAGLIVTSGLALGVDAASHQGALNANGKTIAVLGSGLQKIYPKRHMALAQKIIENGCLISEFPLHTEPAAHHFPKRNRIISGLSLGTLVIEAALKSGSLITTRFALEQGREVFAIPGSIRNPTSQGCLSLIQQGAKCVTKVEDILEEIKWSFNSKQAICISNLQPKLDYTDNPVLACIDNNVTTIDQICSRSKLSVQWVATTILQLEIEGVIKRQFDGYIKTIQ